MPTVTPYRTPKICLHKPTGQAYVRLDGSCHYLGRHDDAKAHEKGYRLIAEWLANGRHLRVDPQEVSVNEVLAAYWKHCESYYRRPDGTLCTGSLDSIRLASATVRKFYGTARAVEFGPLAFRTVREQWIADGLRRTTVNKRAGDIKRAFKWAVSVEMIPASVFHGLQALDGLRKGRTEAKESRKVLPVLDAHIEAIRPHVARQVWGLVQVQLLSGARSGEVLRLRRCDLDTSGEVWSVRLEHHKTSHEGRDRTLYFGAQAQAVLREFFPGKGPADYLFSPKDAEAERRAKRHEERVTPLSCGNKPGSNRKESPTRTAGAFYTADTYRRAIAWGCKAANIPVWHPHQLRHSCATMLRKQFGLDSAAVYLGHARANVTQMYAALDGAQAAEIARKVG
jgi:integrase